MKRNILLVFSIYGLFYLSGCNKVADDLELISDRSKDTTKVVQDSTKTDKDSTKTIPDTTSINTDTIVKNQNPPNLGTAKTYFVSLSGKDTNPGTMDKPLGSWEKAVGMVKPGEQIIIRGGTYKPSGVRNYGIKISGINGQPGKLIKLASYPGERVILDCSNISYNNSIYGIMFKGNYWHFKGIEVINVKQAKLPAGTQSPYCRGFDVSNSNNCIFENLIVHNIEGVGYHMKGDCNNNVITNCDFYNNYDPYSYDMQDKALYDGGYGDGAHVSVGYKGRINYIENCRFWSNSDDGLDLWDNEGIVKIKNCWSFKNGYKPGTTIAKGDGQGFKLGRTSMSRDNTPQRYLSNCLAFENRQSGFDQNSANTIMVFYNNIAYNNGRYGFYLNSFGVPNTYKNNIALKNSTSSQVSISKESTSSNNSWDLKITSLNEWMSTDSRNMSAPRKEDGSLPETTYLHPTSNSLFIDKGVNVGVSYKGKAPDLGAFEVK